MRWPSHAASIGGMNKEYEVFHMTWKLLFVILGIDGRII
jgi:hypothetical protein